MKLIILILIFLIWAGVSFAESVSLRWDAPTSPLAQGRGLKQLQDGRQVRNVCVAPRAGAWIETRSIHRSGRLQLVAPRAGAWIETSHVEDMGNSASVAPRAGAWIETGKRSLQVPV